MRCPNCGHMHRPPETVCGTCGWLFPRGLTPTAPDSSPQPFRDPSREKSAQHDQSLIPPRQKPLRRDSRGWFHRRLVVLFATGAALVLTGGYYASAAGGWQYKPNWGWVSPREAMHLRTTTFAPGTPNWAIYPNSPYRVGGPLGPKPGQTWAQKFDPGLHPPSSSGVSSSTPTGAAHSSVAPDASEAITGSRIQVGPLTGIVPRGWMGHLGQQVPPVGGGTWVNPARSQMQLHIALLSPSFYGADAARNQRNPEWLLARDAGTGWSYRQVVQWQRVGPGEWLYQEPSATDPGWWDDGLVVMPVGQGFTWATIQLRVPTQQKSWWPWVLSWAPRPLTQK